MLRLRWRRPYFRKRRWGRENIAFSSGPQSASSCDTLSHCNDAGGHGIIEETGVGQITNTVSFCLTGTAPGATPVGGDLSCNATAMETHCNEVTVANSSRQQGPGASFQGSKLTGLAGHPFQTQSVLAHMYVPPTMHAQSSSYLRGGLMYVGVPPGARGATAPRPFYASNTGTVNRRRDSRLAPAHQGALR